MVTLRKKLKADCGSMTSEEDTAGLDDKMNKILSEARASFTTVREADLSKPKALM